MHEKDVIYDFWHKMSTSPRYTLHRYCSVNKTLPQAISNFSSTSEHCVLVVITYEEVEQSGILVFFCCGLADELVRDWIPPVLLCKDKDRFWELYIHRQLVFHFLWVLILQSWLLVLLQPFLPYVVITDWGLVCVAHLVLQNTLACFFLDTHLWYVLTFQWRCSRSQWQLWWERG